MSIIIKSPGRYIQGAGELKNLAVHTKKLGESFLVICSDNTRDRIGMQLEENLAAAGKTAIFTGFTGQCSKAEISRIAHVLSQFDCDAVIGAGGGKVIDTAKAVADGADLPLVIIPTIASNDAPCSGIAVIYNDDGVVVKALFTKRNPDVVLVDTDIIVQAPYRLFAAGVGDALSTWFEARAVHTSGAKTMARGNCSHTALALAKLCYDVLLEYGEQALADVKAHITSLAVERVVEATIFLSGVGFESGGLAAAHAVNDGFAHILQTHNMYHGEKVAYGTLVQLILEKAPAEEFTRVKRFVKAMGLPSTLAELGILNPDDEELRIAAEAACVPTQSTKNLPASVTAEDVLAAIHEVDRLGKF